MADKVLPNAKKSDPYHLDPTFERAVAVLCATKPSFWGRIGHALDPDCLASEPAKRILRACRQIAHETKRGPEAAMIVLQHMRRWMDEGKADGALPKIKEVAALMDDAFDTGLPSEDAAVASLKPILTRRLKDEAVVQAIEAGGKDSDDFGKVVKLIDKANRLGDTNTSVGVLLGSGSYAEIEKLKNVERHGTGIWELDSLMNMGMRRGCLGLLVGTSGGGKSMALSHIAAYSIRCGLFTVYATLEVTPADVLARVKGNLTGVPIDNILADPRSVEPLLRAMPLAPLVVQEFTPQATTMPDIEAWVADCEREVGRPIDVLITDYGDKLIAPKNAGKDSDSGYQQGRVVFERMRIYANEGHPGSKIWHWSASQAKRQEKAKAKGVHALMDLNDTADSLHKIRVADLVVTINPLELGIKWLIAKNRHGKSNVATDALPPDFECGRVAPIMVEASPDDVSL
jgi:hypothetical protein